MDPLAEHGPQQVWDAPTFLATTTARLAINVTQSARARREAQMDPRLAEPIDVGTDPAARSSPPIGPETSRRSSGCSRRMSAAVLAPAVLAQREDHRDRLGRQAPGDEGERLRRGPVEPTVAPQVVTPRALSCAS
jgi:hypothetical protein